MPIIIGTNKIKDLYIGNTPLDKVYIGTKLIYQKNRDLIVTREILDQGSFENVTPTYLTNQVDGSDGFTIVGRVAKPWSSSNAYYNLKLRWDIEIDLTSYKTISWYAKKNVNHGSMSVYVSDGMMSTTNETTIYASNGVIYGNLATSWTEYSLDVSEITGTKIVSFVGGYSDSSGNTSSSTSYCNIKFLC